MDRRNSTLLAIVLLSILVIAFSCAKQEISQITLPEGKTAKIVFLVGEVSLNKDDTVWVPAQIGDILGEGTWIRTGPQSYCEIVISSGTLFRMKDHSEILISLLPSSEGDRSSLIRLIKGELLTKVQKIAYRSADSVQTESVTLGVRGTQFLVRKERDSTSVLVGDGAVTVVMNVSEVPKQDLPRGMRSIVTRIERGARVRAGYKLAISKQKVQSLSEKIEDIAALREVTPGELALLKQEATLKPEPLGVDDIRMLEELGTLSLSFETGLTVYLSPNFDGINDEFLFKTAGITDDKLYGWRLTIRDHALRTVKVITSRTLDGETFMKLPEVIEWNMVREDGNTVEDGNYVYEFHTMRKEGRYTLRVKGRIIVDTTPPFLNVEASDITFSPNGDGVKDTIIVEIKAEEGADYSCTITTPEGIVVKKMEWGKGIPSSWEWDGTGENGAVLPEGVYNISIIGKDSAGNTTTETAKEITIDVRQRQASVDVDNQIFSPNGDGYYDTVTFRPVLSDRTRIDTWDLIVQTEKGDTARRFRGLRYIPASIKWDGVPQKGKSYENLPDELPSGRYFYFLKVIYRSGVNTYSFRKELILDNDPPMANVEVTPMLFSPDGDGKDDVLRIRPRISDLTAISGWKAGIYTSSGALFKTFSGMNMPKEEIQWDGISDSGILVDSGEDYYIVLEATDQVHNRQESERVSFSIDILVIPTERGLKIRVSNIEFGFNNANLQGEKTFSILEKIVYVLNKYEKYKIIVEGHTDSTGSESYNLTLSKNRAESVGRYLIDNGVDPQRLSYEGYGSQFPVDTNETKEGRARNRRVEFLLVRK
jgi:outer membrane protein OmpA-like peptidoglycan-associated protein